MCRRAWETGGTAQWPPQDRSSDGEDDRASAGEEDSGEDSDDDSEEEDRDADVDQGFREQLMAVLRAGKALVSGRAGRGGAPCPYPEASRSRASCIRARWTVRTTMTTVTSWGTRP